ncbi:MAG: hypothetical protein ACOYN3_01250 [Acidimicrobiia bacterium]
MTRRRDQRGFMAAEWVAAVGVLLIPAFVIVASATRVPEMQAAAQTIATEAARAGVRASNCAGAQAAAQQAAESSATALGIDQQNVTLDYAGTDWGAGGTLRVTAKVPMPVVLIPGGFEVNLPEVLSASHTEPIDQYRFIDAGCP